jgi:hypothetical protein
MTLILLLNISGLIFNIIGAIILAFSLSRYLTALHGTIYIHSKQLDALINKRDKILVGDVAKLLKAGVKNSQVMTTVGLFLIATGFILQLIPYVMEVTSKK